MRIWFVCCTFMITVHDVVCMPNCVPYQVWVFLGLCFCFSSLWELCQKSDFVEQRQPHRQQQHVFWHNTNRKLKTENKPKKTHRSGNTAHYKYHNTNIYHDNKQTKTSLHSVITWSWTTQVEMRRTKEH